jgi:hypothetical protein
MPLRRSLTQSAVVAAFCLPLLLAGCGGVDGVELNGKIFDVLGVSAASQTKAEPQMADRAPLIVPPSVTRLPEPGSGQTASQELAALKDPEQRKEANAKERERLHAAYCRGDVQWKDKAYKPEASSGAPRSPYGPCSVLGSITDTVNK